MDGIPQSDTLEAEFQLYLATDSAQKTPRSAAGDKHFLDIALHFFVTERQKTLISQIRLEDLQLLQHWIAKEQTIHGKIKKAWGDTTVEYYTRILKKFFRKMFDTERIA